jgi:hypothetical protein
VLPDGWTAKAATGTRHAASQPTKALELLNLITPDDLLYWFSDLRTVLDVIREADPTLVETVPFKRLADIAIAKGLNHAQADYRASWLVIVGAVVITREPCYRRTERT